MSTLYDGFAKQDDEYDSQNERKWHKYLLAELKWPAQYIGKCVKWRDFVMYYAEENQEVNLETKPRGEEHIAYALKRKPRPEHLFIVLDSPSFCKGWWFSPQGETHAFQIQGPKLVWDKSETRFETALELLKRAEKQWEEMKQVKELYKELGKL